VRAALDDLAAAKDLSLFGFLGGRIAAVVVVRCRASGGAQNPTDEGSEQTKASHESGRAVERRAKPNQASKEKQAASEQATPQQAE